MYYSSAQEVFKVGYSGSEWRSPKSACEAVLRDKKILSVLPDKSVETLRHSCQVALS